MSWKGLIWTAGPALVVILVISYVFAGYSSFPSALVAWGTILLAYVTFSLVRHSIDQEERRRGEEILKERRDRDTVWLNDIIDWAVEVVKIGMPPIAANVVLVGKLGEEADRRSIIDSFRTLENSFRAMIAKSLYISRIGLAFGEKLQHSIDELEIYLRKQDDIIRKCLEILVKRKISDFNDAWNELMDNWGTLGDSAANVVDEAVIEKMNILNI